MRLKYPMVRRLGQSRRARRRHLRWWRCHVPLPVPLAGVFVVFVGPGNGLTGRAGVGLPAPVVVEVEGVCD